MDSEPNNENNILATYFKYIPNSINKVVKLPIEKKHVNLLDLLAPLALLFSHSSMNQTECI